MRDTHRERGRQTHKQKEKQAPCREPDVGLDPGTPGSHPGGKACAKPLSHPGIPDTRLCCKSPIDGSQIHLIDPTQGFTIWGTRWAIRQSMFFPVRPHCSPLPISITPAKLA